MFSKSNFWCLLFGPLAVGIGLLAPRAKAQDFKVLKYGSEAEGVQPYSVIAGRDGWIYGIFSREGPEREAPYFSQGTLFRLKVDGSGFSLLHLFGRPNGSFPQAPPILAGDGRLYGVAENIYNPSSSLEGSYAVVYRMDRDGSNYAEIYAHPLSFYNYGDPIELLAGTDGRIYTKCPSGITRIDRNGGNPQIVRMLNEERFNSFQRNQVTFLEGSDGRLYGTYESQDFRGDVQSVLFSMKLDGTDYTVVDTVKGRVFSLIEASDGKIYGSSAGFRMESEAWYPGSIFRLEKSGKHLQELQKFSASLTEGRDGRLYLSSGRQIQAMKKDGSDLQPIETLPTYARYSSGSLVEAAPLIFLGVSASGTTDHPQGMVFRLDATGPTLSIRGPDRVSTSASAVKVRGHAKSIFGLKKVEYRSSTGGGFRRAKGGRAWSFSARLHSGRNVISVRSVDNRGRRSKIQKVVIVRSGSR